MHKQTMFHSFFFFVYIQCRYLSEFVIVLFVESFCRDRGCWLKVDWIVTKINISFLLSGLYQRFCCFKFFDRKKKASCILIWALNSNETKMINCKTFHLTLNRWIWNSIDKIILMKISISLKLSNIKKNELSCETFL